MVEKPEVGKLYWTRASSVESEGYMADEVRKPWPCVVDEDRDGTYRVHHVNEAGEVDTDSNTTAYVGPHALYETELAALDAYAAAAHARVARLMYAAGEQATDIGWASARQRELLSKPQAPPAGPTDRELVLELCRRLKLKRREPPAARWDGTTVLKREYMETEEDITIGEGEGYRGFHVLFKFNPDGSLISHGVWE